MDNEHLYIQKNIFVDHGYLDRSELSYEIYCGGGPSMYVYCLVCYRVITVLCVRNGGMMFLHTYTFLLVFQNALGL